MLNKHGIDYKAIDRDQKAIDKLPNKGRASVDHTTKSKALAKKAGKKIDTTGGMSAGEHNRRALEIERKTGRDYNTGKKINR